MGLKSDFKESFKSDIKSDFKLKRKKYNELRNLLRKRKQTSIFEKEHLFTLISTLSKRQFSKLLTSSFIYLFYFLEMGFLLFFIFFLETFSSSLLIHCSIFLIFFRSYLFNSSLNYYQDYYNKEINNYIY